MPLTQSYVIRAPDTTGDYIKTYADGSLHIQTVLIADDSGSPLGNGTNPLRVKGMVEPAFVLNTSGSEQAITAGSDPVVAGSFHSATTHVLWSTDEPIRAGFIASPSVNIGHYFPQGYSAIWDVTLFSTASFVRAGSADALIYVTPLSWS